MKRVKRWDVEEKKRQSTKRDLECLYRRVPLRLKCADYVRKLAQLEAWVTYKLRRS